MLMIRKYITVLTRSQPGSSPRFACLRHAAELGPIQLYPHQRGIAAAIGDPKVERVARCERRRSGSSSSRSSDAATMPLKESRSALATNADTISARMGSEAMA
jgi:hypothetical protein